MRAARRIKTPEEVVALREAIRVAEVGLAAAVAELRPGVSEKTLAGVFLEAMAAGGVTTPATQDAAWVTSREHPWRRASDDGTFGPATWWRSPPASSTAATPARSAGPWPVGERQRRRRSVPTVGCAVGQALSRPAGPARRPAICSPPTRPPARTCRRCRSRAAWVWVSTRPSCRSICRRRPPRSGWSRAWCWPSPDTSGSGRRRRVRRETRCSSPPTVPRC